MKHLNATISSVTFIILLFLLTGTGAGAKAIREERMGERQIDTAALKEHYESFFPVGNVVSPRDLDGNRFEVLKKHFNILTAENAMKPLYLQPEKGVFAFETADRLVNAALEAGMKMHGHTLAWHQQSPEWINREGIDRAEAIDNLVTHAKTVASHFKGRIVSWDVLNEAVVDNPPNPANWKASLRLTPWLKAIGPEYIEIVFKAAREADPEAKMYYNDYNLDNPNKALAVYNMVKEINNNNRDAGGRPLIDGIGMQGHYRLNTNIDNVEKSLKNFISLGVEVSVTELDVQAGVNSALTDIQALEQGLVYARLFALFRENAAGIGRVTIWGLDDGTSWRKETCPTLLDPGLQAKPAFYGALNPEAFIAENKSRLVKESKEALARYGSPTLDASDPAWERSAAIPVDQYIMAWQGAAGEARALWDEQYLYVRIAVSNAELNKANPAPHEQDSVEIYIDEGNHKSSYYQEDDGQYRVNFDNERSYSSPSIAAGIESRAAASDRSFTVTVKIPFRTIKPAEDTLIGFDLQVNGASERGIRQSVAVWNDTSGSAYLDPSCFGTLRLEK